MPVKSHYILLIACVAVALAGGLLAQEKGGKVGKGKGKDYRKLETGPINPVGRPERLDSLKTRRFAVWFENGHWSLRVTGSPEDKDTLPFAGTVTVDGGTLTEGTFQGLEGGKSKGKKKKLKGADLVNLHRDRAGFDFRWSNSGLTDGIDFEVSKAAKTVTFRLLVGSGEFPEKILIGARGRTPDAATFTLPAHPE